MCLEESHTLLLIAITFGQVWLENSILRLESLRLSFKQAYSLRLGVSGPSGRDRERREGGKGGGGGGEGGEGEGGGGGLGK